MTSSEYTCGCGMPCSLRAGGWMAEIPSRARFGPALPPRSGGCECSAGMRGSHCTASGNPGRQRGNDTAEMPGWEGAPAGAAGAVIPAGRARPGMAMRWEFIAKPLGALHSPGSGDSGFSLLPLGTGESIAV